MKRNTEYGIISSVNDEKLLHTRLNEYIADHHRVFAKTKSKSLLDSYLPFVYKHFYFNLNKGMGVYMALYPNQDMKGKYRYPEEKRVAWILTVLTHKNSPGYEKERTEDYIRNVLQAIGLVYVILYAADDKKEE